MQTIILLHGALGAKSQLDPIADQLKDLFQVYTMNFEGHGGRPSQNDFSIDLFSRNLIDFMDEKEIESANIFGYSMGGYVALKMALDNPERIDRIITLGTKFDWTPESAAREVKMLNPDKIEEKVPRFAAYLKALHNPLGWKELLHKTAEMMIRLGNGEGLSKADFEKIRNNCEIGVGDSDEMVTRVETEQVANALSNGRFYILENTIHPIDKVDAMLIISKIKSSIFDVDQIL